MVELQVFLSSDPDERFPELVASCQQAQKWASEKLGQIDSQKQIGAIFDLLGEGATIVDAAKALDGAWGLVSARHVFLNALDGHLGGNQFRDFYDSQLDSNPAKAEEIDNYFLSIEASLQQRD